MVASSTWEQQLIAEGLGIIDELYRGAIRVSKRTIGGRRVNAPAISEIEVEFLQEGRFRSGRHKAIWALHCQGFGTREIAKRLGMYRLGVIRRLRDMREACEEYHSVARQILEEFAEANDPNRRSKSNGK